MKGGQTSQLSYAIYPPPTHTHTLDQVNQAKKMFIFLRMAALAQHHSPPQSATSINLP